MNLRGLGKIQNNITRRNPAIALILIFLLSHLASAMESTVILAGDINYEIDINSLAIRAIHRDGHISAVTTELIPEQANVVHQTINTLEVSCTNPDLRIHFRATNSELAISVTSQLEQTILWPKYVVSESSDFIWLFGGGRCIPMSDQKWSDYIQGSHPLNGAPFWGHIYSCDTSCWIFETPFRNELLIDKNHFTVSQNFSVRKGPETKRFRYSIANSVNPIYPAQCYRSYLSKTGKFLSAQQKLEDLPPASEDKLLGALHLYVWGYENISEVDIRPTKWTLFAKALLNHPKWEGFLQNNLSDDSYNAIKNLSKNNFACKYHKQVLCEALNQIIEEHSKEVLFNGFQEMFLSPPEKWGQGVSEQMVKDLKSAGINKARLVVDEMTNISRLSKVSQVALETGYLFGVYDSYHSIHPDSIAGTDLSWSTAQIDQNLYDKACLQRKDGTFFEGFNHIGRLLNPVAARSAMQDRVSKNLKMVKMNYYFMDCDGCTGDVSDDHNPNYLSTSEEMIEARKERLKWLRKEKKLIVGTEGYDPGVLMETLVAEWTISPPFFWEDSDFRNKESKYFFGRYWPSHEPEINFKSIPLKPEFTHRYFDPQTRIPLIQTVLHDSVITTNHWNSDNFKYEENEATIQLIQLLYMSPPLYNLNRSHFKKKKDLVMNHYRFFEPLHSEYGFSNLLSFKWLSEERLIQEVEYSGGLRMIANFSTNAFAHKETMIQPMSIIAVLPNGEIKEFQPL